MITGIIRLTGDAAVISWDPITYTSAKGHLTEIDVIYAPSTTNDCSELDLTKNPNVTYTPQDFDLYGTSSHSIDRLEADREYCVAIRVVNDAHTSAYSTPDKVICEFIVVFVVLLLILYFCCWCCFSIYTVQSSSDFQARFNVGGQTTCQDFIVSGIKLLMLVQIIIIIIIIITTTNYYYYYYSCCCCYFLLLLLPCY